MRAGGLGGDPDLDRHAGEVGGGARVGAAQGRRLLGGAGDRDADQVAVADDAVGRVELDPAGAGQVDLRPGVRRAAADFAGMTVEVRVATEAPRRPKIGRARREPL